MSCGVFDGSAEKAGVFLATVAVMAVAGGVAYATIPDSSGVIHACYGPLGVLRVIDTDAGQHCTANEKPLSWSQAGPQGPQGPPGPQGPAGSFSVQRDSPAIAGQGEGATVVDVDCPAGQTAAAGVWTIQPRYVVDGNTLPAYEIQMDASGPYGSGWRFVFENQDIAIPAGNGAVTVTVFCAPTG
jgi:hypothetical protein